MRTINTRAQRGLTLIELMVVVAIMIVLMAIGIPAMQGWLFSAKATGVTEHYADGLKRARDEAIKHNANSRITFSANASGQYDWQVDICFPTADIPCDDTNGVWSTTAAIATGDPEAANGFLSILRSSANLPGPVVLTPTLSPANATMIYFNSLGWIDARVPIVRLQSISFTPGANSPPGVPSSAVYVTLAGTTAKCDPTMVIPDSRACPP